MQLLIIFISNQKHTKHTHLDNLIEVIKQNVTLCVVTWFQNDDIPKFQNSTSFGEAVESFHVLVFNQVWFKSMPFCGALTGARLSLDQLTGAMYSPIPRVQCPRPGYAAEPCNAFLQRFPTFSTYFSFKQITCPRSVIQTAGIRTYCGIAGDNQIPCKAESW